MPQPLRQPQALDRIIGQQQRMLQVIALGLLAFQMLVQGGPGQVVTGQRRSQLHHPLGILQRRDIVAMCRMQLPQVA